MSEQTSADSDQVQQIKNEVDDDLLESAEAVGVDVDDVVLAKADQREGYTPKVVANFVSSTLRSEVEAAEADEVRGIIMGSRDRYGANWPRRHSIVRSDSDHMEVSTWDGTLPAPDGQEVTIPTGGAIVQLQCSYDQEYESYEAKRLDGAKQLDSDDLVEKITKVAVSPDSISRKDEYAVVVVAGTIRSVDPQTIFEDGDPGPDGAVLLEDQRGELQPHFEVSLEQSGTTRLRGHAGRQAYGRAYFQVPDLLKLLHDAYEQTSDPSEQTSFVQAGLEGTDVVLVGTVSNYDTSRSDDREPIHYVDLNISAMVATDQPAQQSIEQTAEADDEGNESPPESPEEAPQPEASPQDEGSRDIAEVRADIEQYAELVGEELEDLTVSDVQENMDLDDPEVAIRAALGGDEPDEPDGEDDEFAPLKEGGTYNCPGDDGDCIASASSIPELAGHATDEHDLGDLKPKEWLRQQMEA